MITKDQRFRFQQQGYIVLEKILSESVLAWLQIQGLGAPRRDLLVKIEKIKRKYRISKNVLYFP